MFDSTSLTLAQLTSSCFQRFQKQQLSQNNSYASPKDINKWIHTRKWLLAADTWIWTIKKADPEGDFWLQLFRWCAVAMANKSVSIRWKTRHLRVCTCVTTFRPGSTALIRNQGWLGENGCKDSYLPTHTGAWYQWFANGIIKVIHVL